MNLKTLSHIGVILKIYYNPDAAEYFSEQDHKICADLVLLGLVKLMEKGSYAATDMGCVYVEMLRDVPLPEQRWVDPREGES